MCDNLFLEVGGLYVVSMASQGSAYVLNQGNHQQGKVTVDTVLSSSISTTEEAVT
jgi:hypothetical protein